MAVVLDRLVRQLQELMQSYDSHNSATRVPPCDVAELGMRIERLHMLDDSFENVRLSRHVLQAAQNADHRVRG